MAQNIFDNEIFFEGYKKIRESEFNYNNLVEQPAIKSLLPDLKDMNICDLGCGYGENCIEFLKKGAKNVVGIDISGKMLEIARNKNSHEKIKYLEMDMQRIHELPGKFDLVFSSLAFHYIEDFGLLIKKIHELLEKDGILIFSQEHPITTAPKNGPGWTKNSEGRKIHYNLSDYMKRGQRKTNWIVDNIEKYHRPVSEILNTLINQGFLIEEIAEPTPDEFALEKRPDFYDEFEKTTSLIIKARKSK